MSWGQLLQIELTECPKDLLASEHRVKMGMLGTVVGAGMKPVRVMDPYTEPPREEGKGPGVTCVCILTESHCAVHTYPDRGACFITLLTCGEMDNVNVIAEKAAGHFGAHHVEYTLLPVGEWWDGTEGRMPPIEPFVLVDLLSLASITVSEDVAEKWTQDEMQEAAEWASAVHADAGDNDGVVVPPKPDFLPEIDAYGPDGTIDLGANVYG